jgi:hypothetical protein
MRMPFQMKSEFDFISALDDYYSNVAQLTVANALCYRTWNRSTKLKELRKIPMRSLPQAKNGDLCVQNVAFC